MLPVKPLAVPKSWSARWTSLSLYAQINPGTGSRLAHGLPVEPDPKPFCRAAQTPATEDRGQFSPDGRWIAYTSNESGHSEILVIPFPLSASGSAVDGIEGRRSTAALAAKRQKLFCIAPDSKKVMAVAIDTQLVFQTQHATRIVSNQHRGHGNSHWADKLGYRPGRQPFLIITGSPGQRVIAHGGAELACWHSSNELHRPDLQRRLARQSPDR